jgi:hypothetical protein
MINTAARRPEPFSERIVIAPFGLTEARVVSTYVL